MSHPIVHIEFWNNNPDAAAKFYSELFGWKIDRSPMPGDMPGEYVQFSSGEGSVAGAFPEADGEFSQPGEVLVYVGTDDIPGTLKRVEELGGSTVAPEMEIPGIGWFAVFTDTAGNRLALYKAMQP